jgi:signal transduction histidine kinase
MLSILDDALLLTHIDVSGEKFRSALVPLDATLNRAIDSAGAFAESRRVTLNLARSPGRAIVLGNEDLLVRAFHALLETAVKFSDENASVQLTCEIVPDSLMVIIDSQGRTVPDPAIAKFFDLFATGETITPGGDHGLGPSLAYRILSLFGASVTIANRDQSGVRMIVAFSAFREFPK